MSPHSLSPFQQLPGPLHGLDASHGIHRPVYPLGSAQVSHMEHRMGVWVSVG